MATKLPVIGPRNTSLPEILGENSERGWLVNSGHTPSHWIIKENDNERMRPLMSVEEAADAIIYIKDNPEEAQAKSDLALVWIKEHTWVNICKQWKNVFTEAKKSLDQKRKMLESLTIKE